MVNQGSDAKARLRQLEEEIEKERKEARQK